MTVARPTKNPPDDEASTEEQLRAEIVRLEKIVQVLMDRAERTTDQDMSEFQLFERTLVLGDVIRQRTDELRRALEQNEKITRTLRESEARFRGLAEQSLAGIAMVEAGCFTYVNLRFAETFGYARDELMALPLMETVSAGSWTAVVEHIRKSLANESVETVLGYKGKKKDGSTIDLELSCSRMEPAAREAVILVVADVTSRRQAERKIQALNRRLAEQAIRDPLTGLYNRRFMEESIARELVRAARNGYPVSLVMCDIDHFKSVNDDHGHQAGDRVLRALGKLLRRRCRSSDIPCRYGGEEFLLVFPDMPGDVAVEWAEHMRAAVEAMVIRHQGRTVRVTASFGVAVYPTHGTTPQQVMSAADDAQYAAKAAGRNQVKRAPVLALFD
ncbi:MAG: GGDEF domain-containing protein [Thermoleophilia bacterium]|nr:GGDEF domain-containing protein [Thermoleophilia bacterium]